MSLRPAVGAAGAASGRLSLSRDALIAWGEALGRTVSPSAVIGLSGELGAGKTTLAQAICRGFGVASQVTSPTFALVQEYSGTRGRVFHLDLYRLSGPRDLTNLAWSDIINSGALVLVEWPERAEAWMPTETMTIRLSYDEGSADRRLLEVEPPC